MRSAHSGLSSSWRTSIARTSRAKISASRESSIRTTEVVKYRIFSMSSMGTTWPTCLTICFPVIFRRMPRVKNAGVPRV